MSVKELHTTIGIVADFIDGQGLQESFGKCRTFFKSMCLDKVILPFPAIDEKLSSAILIFSFLEQGE